ncbi:MAG: CvpA family protein [Bacteroidota bacterium]
MRLLDILLLILMAWGGYSGLRKGVIGEILSTGALVMAALGSLRFRGSAVKLLSPWFQGQDALLPYVVSACLFVFILMAITVVGKLFKALIKSTILGSLDRFLGSMLGVFKWSTGVSALLWAGDLVQLKIPEAYTEDTFLFPIIESLAPKLLAWCTTWIPYLQEWFTTTNTS